MSLRLQTWTDWECVVVDDGSKVALAPVVESLADPRIRLIRHEVNRGRGAARVTGLAAVRTPIVVWQDADDWSYPERLEVQLAALRAEPRATFVAARVAMADRHERMTGILGRDRQEPHRLQGCERPAFPHAVLMFRREVLDHIPYRGQFHTSEDHDFLMRALREFDFVELPDVLYAYREEQSRSVRKYYESTKTRVRVAVTLSQARPRDRLRLAVTHLAKLGVVAGAELIGQRGRIIRSAQALPTAEEVARYEQRRAELESALAASS